MKVIRIEHMSVMRDGFPCGPYGDNYMFEAEHDDSSPDCLDCLNKCIHNYMGKLALVIGKNRPMPRQDGLWDYFNRLFCFRSVEQMREWFIGDLRTLARYGFVAAVYDVNDDHMDHGGKQSIFSPRDAIRIGDCSILAYSKIAKMLV